MAPQVARGSLARPVANRPPKRSMASKESPSANELIEPALELFDPAIGIVEVKRRLGTAQNQVAVWFEQASHFAQDGALGRHLKIDHHIAQKHHIQTWQEWPTLDQVDFLEIDHLADI